MTLNQSLCAGLEAAVRMPKPEGTLGGIQVMTTKLHPVQEANTMTLRPRAVNRLGQQLVDAEEVR